MLKLRGLGRATLLAIIVLSCATGCEGNDTHSRAAISNGSAITFSSTTTTPPIRQTDSQGRPLPFMTVHPHRWSNINDGTEYEPCTSLTPAALRHLGIDPDSVEDAAWSDHQTARGCHWRYSGDRWTWMSQIVGNAPARNPTLEGYEELNRDLFTWWPPIVLDGRRVAISVDSPDLCTTHVQSGTALVGTSVSMGDAGTRPPLQQICDRAIAFTKATIGNMPK